MNTPFLEDHTRDLGHPHMISRHVATYYYTDDDRRRAKPLTGLEFHNFKSDIIESWFVDADPIMPLMRAASDIALRKNIPGTMGKFVLSRDVAARLEKEFEEIRTIYSGPVFADGGSFCGYSIEVAE